MLQLSRGLNEVIRVGDEVSIRVLEVKGNSVRLGIQAPRDVKVNREEVALRGEAPESDTDV